MSRIKLRRPWSRWKDARWRELRREGFNTDNAILIAGVEARYRQKLATLIGAQNARDLKLAVRTHGDKVHFIIVGSLASLKPEQLAKIEEKFPVSRAVATVS